MTDEIIIREPLAVYRGKFHHKFCTQVVQHMRSGKSLRSFAGTIGVSPTTIDRWAKENEEFAEAIEIAKSINLCTWEDIAIEQATGESKGQSSTLTFMLKNLHAETYKDKVNVEQEGNLSFIINTGIPTQIPDNMLDIKSVDAEFSKVEEDDESEWSSPDEDLL